MPAIELFTNSVKYKYKANICSLSALVVVFFITLSIISPILIISNTGGFWLKNRVHIEPPDTKFEYKYLLVAEKGDDTSTIVCSTFSTYKENRIVDDCVLVKVQEVDTNSDGREDILKFQAHFYTDKPVKSIKLLLFFNFYLRQLIETAIESFAVFDCVLNQEVQKIQFFGDVELYQKGLLHSKGLYEMYNDSIELADYSLSELLQHNTNRKFLARIINSQVTWEAGFSNQHVTIVEGVFSYTDHVIRYQPEFWEEIKGAWIQYLSFLLVFLYLMKHILVFLFTKRYLKSYVLIPWRHES